MALNQNTPASAKKQASKKRMRLSEDERKTLANHISLLKELDYARRRGLHATNRLLSTLQDFGMSSASLTAQGDWVN